jgi:hypothetical protein
VKLAAFLAKNPAIADQMRKINALQERLETEKGTTIAVVPEADLSAPALPEAESEGLLD